MKLRKRLNEAVETAGAADMVVCPKPIEKINGRWKVFLAGPIQGAPKWQFEMPRIEGVMWMSPRRRRHPDPDFNYGEQVAWETLGLRIADVVLFWIPEPVEDIEGRSYAQTTRFELGENIARGKKVIIGGYKDFPGMRYFKEKSKTYSNVLGVYDNLDDCVKRLREYIRECEKKPMTYFTADTHFGSERALELSRRPFSDVREMDETMMANWNDTVKPCDTVYHLGDFGENLDVLKYLNGRKVLVYGNYERDGKYEVERKWFDEVGKKGRVLDDTSLFICHEPTAAKRYVKSHDDADFAVFGHIHGRQKVKEFGVDCGVDANNFRPVSLDEVMFYRNAVMKGYYDDDVWC